VAEVLVADVDGPEEGEADGPGLPGGLLGLLDRSQRLYERVSHLDQRMYCEPAAASEANPVDVQLQRLRAAFGG
jgi:regulator of CtrA degradation